MDSSRPRNSTRAPRARSVKSQPKGGRKPPATPKRSKLSTTPASTQVTEAGKRLVSTTVLQRLQDNLELIRSTATVVAHALEEQNCELDNDAATTLRHHVADALTQQVIEIGILIHGGES